MAKPTLTAQTIWGPVTRTTAHAYKWVVVGPVMAEEERAGLTRAIRAQETHAAMMDQSEAFRVHARKQLVTFRAQLKALDGKTGAIGAYAAAWSSSRALAQRAMEKYRTYRDPSFRETIVPVDGTTPTTLES